MCGICGEFQFYPYQSPFDHSDWLQLVRRMVRRGPDDEGIWSDQRCLLGFRRLAILDTSPSANQPMVTSDGQYALVFNGELYNFRELRTELRDTVCFRTTGDSEVVLHSLIAWGARALNRFNGMFALAFYSRREGTLLLARDHVGMKPLYFCADRSGVIFASQYDQIVRHPKGRNRGFCADATAMYLRLGYVPAPGGLLSGTEMIQQGSYVSFSCEGAVSYRRYFDFPQHTAASLAGREAVEALSATLGQAVRRHLVSDVPVGFFLSGGVDSPLIASIARDAMNDLSPDAFSIGSSDPTIDELSQARLHAKNLHLKLHTVRMTERDATDLVDEVLAATTEPQADEGMFPSLTLARLAARHVKVALSGDGGDELFWGYTHRQCAFLRNRTPSWQRYFGYLSEFTSREFTDCFPGTVWFPSGDPLFDVQHTERELLPYAIRSYEVSNYLPFILLKTDRASMHHSLEVRLPFLDTEVIQIASRIQWDDCLDLRSRTGKGPLRRLLARRSNVAMLAKRGFTAPMDHWTRGPLRARLAERLSALDGLAGVEIDRHSLDRLWNDHLSGRVQRGIPLWRIFVLAEWIRLHLH